MGGLPTEERRKRQSELIKTWQPWKQSTGAKTAEGKANSAQNALVHGFRSKAYQDAVKEINALIDDCSYTLDEIGQK